MKKFQGSSVPRPSMKKISQTALYLGMGEESGGLGRYNIGATLMAQIIKNLPAMYETWV